MLAARTVRRVLQPPHPPQQGALCSSCQNRLVYKGARSLDWKLGLHERLVDDQADDCPLLSEQSLAPNRQSCEHRSNGPHRVDNVPSGDSHLLMASNPAAKASGQVEVVAATRSSSEA